MLSFSSALFFSPKHSFSSRPSMCRLCIFACRVSNCSSSRIGAATEPETKVHQYRHDILNTDTVNPFRFKAVLTETHLWKTRACCCLFKSLNFETSWILSAALRCSMCVLNIVRSFCWISSGHSYEFPLFELCELCSWICFTGWAC